MKNNQEDSVSEIAAGEAPGAAGMQQSGVGATLREARERLGLSVDDVFARIKFAPRQILALEADDFSQLPEAAFVRGFVRSYARLLQLDPEKLLSALPFQSQEQPAPVFENKLAEVPFPNVYFARRHNIIWLAAALVVALALGLFTLLHSGKPDAPSVPAAPQVKVETLELPPVALLSESSVLAASAPLQATELPQAMPMNVPAARPVESKPSAEPPASLRASSAVVATSAMPANAPAVKKETGSQPRQAGAIRMTFDDDSWVEVTDKDGKILLSQINTRGSEQNLDGRPPFSLVIGRSAVVRLYYKGKQIDLAPHTKVSTARLTLE